MEADAGPAAEEDKSEEAMKIIRVDNFNREYIPDSLVAENVQFEGYAKVMCDALNNRYSDAHSPDFFVVKPDDYELQKFEP